MPVPLKQQNLQRAVELAVDALADQSEEQMRWLGAERLGDRWSLPVLGQPLEADVSAGLVVTAAGEAVGLPWRILVLHYLAVRSRPEPREPGVTFADLATARSYAGVYHGRVIARLCGTAGRTAETLRVAAADLGAEPIAAGDAAFDFRVFPRLTLRLVWHAADDEFPATATLLLPDNIEEFLPAEDVVVLSESLVARLGGRPF
jgi:hypothetical protein